jgi:hypothetical protein
MEAALDRAESPSKQEHPFAALVRSFPSLREAPRTPERLLEWLTEAPTSETACHAAAFCLQQAGHNVAFELYDAVSVWDRAHLGALFRACAGQPLG